MAAEEARALDRNRLFLSGVPSANDTVSMTGLLTGCGERFRNARCSRELARIDRIAVHSGRSPCEIRREIRRESRNGVGVGKFGKSGDAEEAAESVLIAQWSVDGASRNVRTGQEPDRWDRWNGFTRARSAARVDATASPKRNRKRNRKQRVYRRNRVRREERTIGLPFHFHRIALVIQIAYLDHDPFPRRVGGASMVVPLIDRFASDGSAWPANRGLGLSIENPAKLPAAALALRRTERNGVRTRRRKSRIRLPRVIPPKLHGRFPLVLVVL